MFYGVDAPKISILDFGNEHNKRDCGLINEITKQAGNVMHDQIKKNQDKYANAEDHDTTRLDIVITGIRIQYMAPKRLVLPGRFYPTEFVAKRMSFLRINNDISDCQETYSIS